MDHYCSIDKADNMLVSDYNNYRLQIFDDTRQCQVIKLPMTSNPAHAVMQDEELWLIQYHPTALVKLVLYSQ